MALDNQAFGNALEVIGQGVSQSTSQYFDGQIKAAQQAQEQGLKAMEQKAQSDQKQQEMAETHRHNIVDEADTQAKTAAEVNNQATNTALRAQEVAGEQTLHEAEESNLADESTMRHAQFGLDVQKTSDAEAKQAKDEAAAGKLSWQQKEQYQNVNADLKDAIQTRDAAQKQLDGAGQYGDQDGSIAKQVKEANDKVLALRQQRDSLLHGGDTDMAPSTSPTTSTTHPSQGAGQAGGKPITATGPNGQKVQLVNGQWVPMNG
jgi:membrane protein involved in colicin uptake